MAPVAILIAVPPGTDLAQRALDAVNKALAQGMDVDIFLMAEGVGLAGEEGLRRERVEVVACATSAHRLGLEGLGWAMRGNQADLARMAARCRSFLAFAPGWGALERRGLAVGHGQEALIVISTPPSSLRCQEALRMAVGLTLDNIKVNLLPLDQGILGPGPQLRYIQYLQDAGHRVLAQDEWPEALVRGKVLVEW